MRAPFTTKSPLAPFRRSHMPKETLPPLKPGDRVGDVTVLAVHGETVDLRCERFTSDGTTCGRVERGRRYDTIAAARHQGRRPSCKPCGRELTRTKRKPFVRSSARRAAE